MIATITRHQVGTVERAIKIFLELELINQLPNNILYMVDIEFFIGKSSADWSVESLANKSRRPHSHSNQYTEKEF